MIGPEAVAVLARHAAGSFRDALGTLEQLQTYAGGEIALGDVLAVLGISDAELLFEAFDAIAAADPRRALAAASGAVDSGHDPAAFIRELEIHARELLVVQMEGGKVPSELSLTPERDERLAAAGREPGLRRAGAHARPAGRRADPPARRRRRAHPARAGARQGRARRPRPQPRRADGADRAARTRRRSPRLSLRRPLPSRPEAKRRRQSLPSRRPPTPRRRRPSRPARSACARPTATSGTRGLRRLQTAPLSLERLVGVWPDVLDTVRAGNAMLGAVVDVARPVELAGRSPGARVRRGRPVPAPEGRGARDASRARRGGARGHRPRPHASATSCARGTVRRRPQALSEDELVARLKDEFGAEELPGNEEEDG